MSKLNLQSTGFVLIYLFLLTIFFFSANLSIYSYIKYFFGILDSYLIDQLLFAGIFMIYFIFGVLLKKIRVSLTDLLVFILLFLISLGTHSEIFERYFYQEDFLYNLGTLRVSDTTDFYSFKSYYTVYPFLPFVLIYKFFQADINAYNFFTLVFLSTSAFFFYKLSQTIIPMRNNLINILAFLVSLIYLTSPTYLEAYLWISVSLEGGVTYSLMLVGIIFYILFLKKRENYYFLGAFLVSLFLIKTSFARVGFLPFLFILLELLFLTRKEIRMFLVRSILLTVATFYLLMQTVYFKQIFDGSGGNMMENLYLLFAYLPQTILPFEWFTKLYSLFQSSFIYEFQPTRYHFYFSFGFLISLLLSSFVFKIRDKILSRLYLFFIMAALISLFFFVNFGSLGKVDSIESFDRNLSKYSIIIGHRYFQVVNILFSSAILILLSTTILKYPKSTIFTTIILCYVLWYNVTDIKKHNIVFSRDYGLHHKTFYEGILGLVPADQNRKILFLTNGEKWTSRINKEQSTFGAFYPEDTILYFDKGEKLMEELRKGNFDKNNFYAFYLDDKLITFIDQTQEYRKKLFSE